MKFSFFILAIFILVAGSAIQAQNLENSEHDLMEYITTNSLGFTIVEEPYSQFEGNPYLFKKFDEGKVVMKSGDVLTGIFRLDLYANTIQFKYEDKIGRLNFPEQISKFKMGGKIIKYLNYIDKEKNKSGYFISLIDKHVSLYIKKEKVLMERQISKAYQQPSPARFFGKKDAYYLMIGENLAVKVNKKKILLDLFPDYAVEISEQIKREKIHLNNQDDLVQLVNYLNDIMAKSMTPMD
ncbi:MAG: hypothetical protein KAX05_14960 [Bacteroidales bacterium]|nr:hypothetical protein [Bacteroidales bacterium]